MSEPESAGSSDPPASPELSGWRELWETDRRPGLEPAPGLLGTLKLALKRFIRRLAWGAQADLWERQRQYNLRLQSAMEATEALAAELPRVRERQAARLEDLHTEIGRVAADLQQVQGELVRDVREARRAQEREGKEIYDSLTADLRQLHDSHLEFLQSHSERLQRVEDFQQDGIHDVMKHTDALFSRVDQKFDRYRRQSRHLWGRLEGLLAVAARDEPAPLVRAAAEQGYVELERMFRGVEADIAGRIEPYLEFLRDRGEVLDLGCGRGEALALLEAASIPCRGVDGNAEMVQLCRDKGLQVEEGDLFAALAAQPEASLGGVVSFHVIEHLPADSLDRLVRLAWRSLAPGGVLALETPNPLSLVVAARNFWLDPTHRRPVHPATLALSYELAGFDPVQRLDLQPFAAADRLPEIARDGLPEELGEWAEEVTRLRDELDRLLFGYQDYGLVGFKPAP